MAEVGHIGGGFDIKGRLRRDHKELAPGKRPPRRARQLRFQRAGDDVHVFLRIGLEGVFPRLDHAGRGVAIRRVQSQALAIAVTQDIQASVATVVTAAKVDTLAQDIADIQEVDILVILALDTVDIQDQVIQDIVEPLEQE